jgi:RHS repeat-associated protein
VSIDTTTLTFDALDRLVEGNNNGSYTQYVYGLAGNELALMNGQTLLKTRIPYPGGGAAVYLPGSSGPTLVRYWHRDWRGSVVFVYNVSGSVFTDAAYAPYGEPTHPGQQPFAWLPSETYSDLGDALYREYSIPQGRWLSPDRAGLAAVDPSDPQTWNMYAYVRNNPTSLTDPSGLDFNLECTSESDTCHNKQVGTWATDENNNRTFTASVVTSASLQDANSGNTAVVNASGVQITTAQGTYAGVFINGTPSATIQGDPKAAGWSDFTFNIFGSDVQHGNLDYGSATYKGSSNQSDVMNALSKMSGEFTYPGEGTLYNNHPGNFNFRFSTGADPSLFNYGPSPHFTVPQEPRPTVPVGPGYAMGFHVDSMTGSIPHVLCAKLGWCQ